MTLDELLEYIRNHAGTGSATRWYFLSPHDFVGRKPIRTYRGDCPLTDTASTMVGFVAGVTQARWAGLLMKMSHEDISTVIATADDWKNSTYYDPELRKRLLAACDLSEET